MLMPAAAGLHQPPPRQRLRPTGTFAPAWPGLKLRGDHVYGSTLSISILTTAHRDPSNNACTPGEAWALISGNPSSEPSRMHETWQARAHYPSWERQALEGEKALLPAKGGSGVPACTTPSSCPLGGTHALLDQGQSSHAFTRPTLTPGDSTTGP